MIYQNSDHSKQRSFKIGDYQIQRSSRCDSRKATIWLGIDSVGRDVGVASGLEYAGTISDRPQSECLSRTLAGRLHVSDVWLLSL